MDNAELRWVRMHTSRVPFGFAGLVYSLPVNLSGCSRMPHRPAGGMLSNIGRIGGRLLGWSKGVVCQLIFHLLQCSF